MGIKVLLMEAGPMVNIERLQKVPPEAYDYVLGRSPFK